MGDIVEMGVPLQIQQIISRKSSVVRSFTLKVKLHPILRHTKKSHQKFCDSDFNSELELDEHILIIRDVVP